MKSPWVHLKIIFNRIRGMVHSWVSKLKKIYVVVQNKTMFNSLRNVLNSDTILQWMAAGWNIYEQYIGTKIDKQDILYCESIQTTDLWQV